MNKNTIHPLILAILDGWGHCQNKHGNAIEFAQTSTIDFLWQMYPHTLIEASGQKVGLPKNQMGNSEVGHMTIGAGRTIDQELVKISKSIKNKDFFYNKLLKKIYINTYKKKSYI